MKNDIITKVAAHLYIWGWETALILLQIFCVIIGGWINLPVAIGLALVMASKIRHVTNGIPTRAIHVPIKY